MTEIVPEVVPPVDPEATSEATTDQVDTPELAVGNIVFFEAAVFGETEPVIFAGIVIHAEAGRVRVKSLGAAEHSADFPAAFVHLNA